MACSSKAICFSMIGVCLQVHTFQTPPLIRSPARDARSVSVGEGCVPETNVSLLHLVTGLSCAASRDARAAGWPVAATAATGVAVAIVKNRFVHGTYKRLPRAIVAMIKQPAQGLKRRYASTPADGRPTADLHCHPAVGRSDPLSSLTRKQTGRR